jgi:hypothetical protein
MKTKFLLLSCVCLATFLATSHLMERARPARAQQAVAGPQDEDTQPLDPDCISAASEVGFVAASNPASFADGEFPAQATARFVDRDADQTLWWSLRISSYDQTDDDGSPTLVFSRAYEPFAVPQGTTITPTFAETVPLQPGHYVAEISLRTTTTVYDPATDTTTTDAEVVASDVLSFAIAP